jgi:hypothetical protein
LKKSITLLQDIATERTLHPGHAEARPTSSAQADFPLQELRARGWAGYGILEILFDPETRQRKNINMNPQMAMLVSNSTIDELLRRLLNDDFSLAFAPFDFLLLLADEIQHDFGDNRVRYLRVITEGKATHHAALVCLFSEKELDSRGQLVTV